MSKKSVTADERNRMIAEAAYFRSLNRKPGVGSDVEDWLAAELEIDARFDLGRHDQSELRDFYEHLAEEACCTGTYQALARIQSEVAADAAVGDLVESRGVVRHDNEFEALAVRLMDADARIAGLDAGGTPECSAQVDALRRLRDLFACELDSARRDAGGAGTTARRRARAIAEQIAELLAAVPATDAGR